MSTSRPFAEPEALLAHQPFLRAIARSLLRGADGEDDVVQEALVRASQSPPPAAARARAWLGRIARNVGLDQLRAARRARALQAHAPARDDAPSAEDVLQQEEQRRHVVHAVLALPQPYRSVVLLRYWDDLAPAQIAARLVVPAATVRSQLQRGLAMVRERLDAEYGDRGTWLAALAPVAGVRGASTSLALGTLLMTKTKPLAVGAALLLAAFSAWLVLAPAAPPPPVAPHGEPAPDAAPTPMAASPALAAAPLAKAPDAAAVRIAAAPDGELVVRGQVLCKRLPYGDAVLTLQWFAGAAASGAPASEHQVVADAEGRFEWRGPRREAASFVVASAPRQRLKLWCTGEVVLPEQREVALEVSVVPLDRVLTGRVHDAAGAPIAGARLDVNLWPETLVVSDANGRYTMHVPAPGYPLAVRAPGYRQRLLEGYLPADAMRHELDVELLPGARVTGRVVDGDARPIAAAQVRASGTFDTLATDADGRFLVDGVGSGERCTVSVAKPGFQRATAFGVGGGEPIEIVLHPGLAVALRAVDTAGAPVVGAAVHLVATPMSGWSRQGTTGPDGRFPLADLPSRPIDVVVEKAGHVSVRRTVNAREHSGELVVELPPGHTLRGQVLGADGAPLAGASISCVRGEPRAILRVDDLPSPVGSRANTDSEGRFAITGVPPERCTLTAHHADHVRATFAFVGGAVAETTLRLQRAPAIAGVVLDGITGAPIPGFTVELESAAVPKVQVRAADGRFRVRDSRLATDAPTMVEVRADGYAPTRFTANALPEPPPDHHVVRLFVGVRVEGVVRDPRSGEPVPGVTVALERPDRMHRPGEGPATGADGRFVLDAVPAGDHRLRLQHVDRPEVLFGPFAVPAGPGSLEVQPTMGAGVVLRGRVTGAPDAAGVAIGAYRSGGQMVRTTVRDDQTFELRGLGVGRTAVQLTGRDGRARSRWLEIGDADVDGYEFAWRLGTGALRLTIDGAANGTVDVRRIDGDEGARTHDSVAFSSAPVLVDGLAPGRYRVTVEGPKVRSRGTAEVDVAATELAVRVECKPRD